MEYSTELQQIIDAIVRNGDSEELRAKAHKQALTDGIDPDEVDIIIKGRLIKAKKEMSQRQTMPNSITPPPPPAPEYHNTASYQPNVIQNQTVNDNANIKKYFIYGLSAVVIVILLIYFLFVRGNNNSNEPQVSDTTKVVTVMDTVTVEKEAETPDNSVQDEITERVDNIYAEAVDGGNDMFVFKKFCSKAFCNLYAKYEKATEGEMGSLDYDVWSQAQDVSNFKTEVKSVDVKGDDKADVKLAITNFGKTKTITLKMVKENDKWMIDDFVNTDHSVKKLMQEDINSFSNIEE